MGGWLALVFGASLLLLTVISNSSLGLAQRFDNEGREASAQVLDRYERVTTDSDGDRKVTYYLELRFETRQGEQITVTRSVGSSVYNRTTVGEVHRIWYLESEPDRIEVSRGENRSTATITRWVALIFGLLTLGALWIPGRKAVAAVRARRYGARETAVVTGLTRTSYRVNNRYRYRLTWREDSGRVGQSLAYREDELSAFPADTKITVYQGLKRAWWSGDVGERPEAKGA